MSTKNNLASALLILALGSLGCGYLGGAESTPTANSNQSVTDRAINSTIGRSNVGIPECDQVLDAIETELNNPDDNFVVKAAKAAALNRIKDSIRLELEQNTNNADVAAACREFKVQFDRFKAGEKPNNNGNGQW